MLNVTGLPRPCVRALLVLTLLAGVLTGCESNPFLRRQATEAISANDLGKAERVLTQAIQQRPGDGLAQYLLGTVRLKQNRNLDAQLHLERAWTLLHGQPLRAEEIDPVPAVLDALAESIYRQNANAALIAMLQNSASEYGKSRDFVRQAEYLLKIHDVDGAKLAFRKAARLSDLDDEQPYLRLAELFESLGDKENTVASLRIAYGIKPNSPRIIAWLAKYGVQAGPGVEVAPDRSDVLPKK